MKRVLPILIFVAMAAPLFSFRFYPIVQDFGPVGSDATQNFYVENTTENRIAVQVSVATRDMNPDGTETHKNADEDFLVFPSQIILEPGRRQTVRVQWLGSAAVAVERAYRIIAEQLPIDFGDTEDGGGQIDIMFRYLGAVYVVPPEASADVQVESARIVGDVARIVVVNDGTAHTLLKDLEVSLGEGESVVLTEDQLAGMAGENILAGSRRAFELSLPRRLPEGPTNAEIRYTETR